MKFDWKHWLPHFITWFLLLILIGCNIWLIRSELKRRNTKLVLLGSGSSIDDKHDKGVPDGPDKNDDE